MREDTARWNIATANLPSTVTLTGTGWLALVTHASQAAISGPVCTAVLNCLPAEWEERYYEQGCAPDVLIEFVKVMVATIEKHQLTVPVLDDAEEVLGG